MMSGNRDAQVNRLQAEGREAVTEHKNLMDSIRHWHAGLWHYYYVQTQILMLGSERVKDVRKVIDDMVVVIHAAGLRTIPEEETERKSAEKTKAEAAAKIAEAEKTKEKATADLAAAKKTLTEAQGKADAAAKLHDNLEGTK